jgi:hypothetical protein
MPKKVPCGRREVELMVSVPMLSNASAPNATSDSDALVIELGAVKLAVSVNQSALGGTAKVVKNSRLLAGPVSDTFRKSCADEDTTAANV